MERAVRSGVSKVGAVRATLAGLCALLVGIGLARFAYTPLIPALIDAAWFTAAQAAYLGAANLVGYLAGALLGRRLAVNIATPVVLRVMMVAATASFFASALPWSFTWFFGWRFVAGFAGGVLMVLAAPAILQRIAPERRGLAGGVIFTGVGLGIAASGTLVPLLLTQGLAVTWCGLGAVALVLTALSWRGWPGDVQMGGATGPAPRAKNVLAIYAEYGLNAFGLVPHMVFLVVYVAHGLGQGIAAGAQYWVLFGIGAAFGPVLAGRLADRIGFAWALRLALAVQTVAVALVVLPTGALGLAVSSIAAGAAVPGVVPLVLGRVTELVRPQQVRAAWSFATTGWAVGQAVGAYGLSYLYAQTGSYALLFMLGTGAVFAALLIDLAFGRRPR